MPLKAERADLFVRFEPNPFLHLLAGQLSHPKETIRGLQVMDNQDSNASVGNQTSSLNYHPISQQPSPSMLDTFPRRHVHPFLKTKNLQLAFWDSRTLAVALSRGRIQLRDVGQSRRASMTSVVSTTSSGSMSTNVTADWIAHCGPVTCMATRPTGNTYSVGGATAGGGGTTRHRRRSSRSGGSLDLGYRWAASGAGASALFAKPPMLATGGGDGKVKVWTDEGRAGGGAEGFGVDGVGGGSDCGEGRLGSTGHEGAVLSVCWHPGGEVIASAGQDWAVWLWDTEGRALSYVHSHRRWTGALAFSAAGDVLVSSGKSGCEGWLISVADDKKEAALCWRQPPKLAATLAKVRGKEKGG